jgi:hypothetical protein
MARYDDDDDDDDDRDDEAVSERPIKKKRKRGNASEGGFLGFLLFRKFIGDWILIILYWLIVGLCILGGLGVMVMGVIGGARAGGGGAALLIGLAVLYGFLLIFVYPIVLRVYFELALIIYRIHEALLEIRDNTK